MAAKYTYTIGRRKTASAQVKLFEGKGDDTVNGKKIAEYITQYLPKELLARKLHQFAETAKKLIENRSGDRN